MQSKRGQYLFLDLIIIGIVVVFVLSSSTDREQIERHNREYQNLLSSLPTTTIQRLDIYHLANYAVAPLYRSISDPQELAHFAQAIVPVREEVRNHPQYIQGFYIVLLLADGEKFEFDFRLKAPPDHIVYIAFCKREKDITHYWGWVQTPDSRLYDWLRSVGVLE